MNRSAIAFAVICAALSLSGSASLGSNLPGAGVGLSAHDDTAAAYQKLVAERGAAVVTVKFVLKIEAGGMGEDAEQETEVYGVMIDPKGLVLMSNSELDGFAGMMRRFRGGSFTTTPKDLKVLIGDDTEGMPGKVLARDTELDLAWIQIEKPGDKPLAHIDPAKGVKANLGDRLLALEKMGKYFDRAPVVQEVRVGAVTSKPRPTYVFTGGFIAGRGVPVFTVGGEFVGMTTLLVPSAEEMEGGALRSSMGGYFGTSPKILPASELVTATKRAREAAEADKPADKPADKAPEKPADAPADKSGGK